MTGTDARPNVHAEVLLSAARRYGDAKLAIERSTLPIDTPEWEEMVAAWREAEGNLHSAARAYATRMRRRPAKGATNGDTATPTEADHG